MYRSVSAVLHPIRAIQPIHLLPSSFLHDHTTSSTIAYQHTSISEFVPGNLVFLRRQHQFFFRHVEVAQQLLDSGRFKARVPELHPPAPLQVLSLRGLECFATNSPAGFSGTCDQATAGAGMADVKAAAQRGTVVTVPVGLVAALALGAE